MTYRIAEAADLVGVPATTLRYYEDIGLMPAPGRRANGYRVYEERDLARLRFISATKNLGIPLADVKALAAAYDVEDCSSVAHQVVELVAARLAETQDRIGELVALAGQLQDGVRPARRRADLGLLRRRLPVHHGDDRAPRTDLRPAHPQTRGPADRVHARAGRRPRPPHRLAGAARPRGGPGGHRGRRLPDVPCRRRPGSSDRRSRRRRAALLPLLHLHDPADAPDASAWTSRHRPTPGTSSRRCSADPPDRVGRCTSRTPTWRCGRTDHRRTP